MAEFLSDAWREQLDAALRAADGLTCDRALVVETRVRTAGGDVGYQVHIGPSGASVTGLGRAVADVGLVTDAATAWAMHQGAVMAQDAFARGVLKVRGRPELLVAHAALLARLEEALAPVRASTTAPAAAVDDR